MQREVPLAPLDPADVSGMESGSLAERFLRQSQLLTALPDAVAEGLEVWMTAGGGLGHGRILADSADDRSRDDEYDLDMLWSNVALADHPDDAPCPTRDAFRRLHLFEIGIALDALSRPAHRMVTGACNGETADTLALHRAALELPVPEFHRVVATLVVPVQPSDEWPDGLVRLTLAAVFEEGARSRSRR